MLKKIVIAAVLGIGAFTTVLPAAQAGNVVTVTAVVQPTAAVKTVSNATIVGWNGSAKAATTFSVVVDSNDPAGYTFTFTGANATTGAFILKGANSGHTVPYTVSVAGSAETYANGIAGKVVGAGTPSDDARSTFTVTLPAEPDVVADGYADALTVAVNPL